MKCEKCNEREANFFYQSNINGQVTERHLCAECAAEEGLLRGGADFPFGFGGMLDSMWRSPFALMDSLWSGGLTRGLSGSVLAAPAAERPSAQRPAPEDGAVRIPIDAGEEFRARREVGELKAKLRKAVEAEDFETAIRLRDEIRRREQAS